LKRNKRPNLDRLRKAEEPFKKEIQVYYEGSEKGLIVGLYDYQDKFLTLGIICGVDYKRQVVKTRTQATRNVSAIQVGCVRLSTTFSEINTTPDTRTSKASWKSTPSRPDNACTVQSLRGDSSSQSDKQDVNNILVLRGRAVEASLLHLRSQLSHQSTAAS
jgi:hypothetical protein